jgi:hypothetical protein
MGDGRWEMGDEYLLLTPYSLLLTPSTLAQTTDRLL